MADIPAQHRAQAPATIRCAVITVSDTRTPATDTGGALVADMLTAAGHTLVERRIVQDEPLQIGSTLETYRDGGRVDVVLLTGGTGLNSRDQTIETISGLLTKTMPGYGELFRMLSYAEIGPAAMLSRAMGGVMGKVLVLSMPGSPAGVRLAMEKVILPDLGHLVREASK